MYLCSKSEQAETITWQLKLISLACWLSVSRLIISSSPSQYVALERTLALKRRLLWKVASRANLFLPFVLWPPQIQSNESWVAAFDMVNGSGTMWRCLFSVIVGCCCGSSIIQMHVTFVVWCQYRYSTKKRNAWHAFPSACQCVAFRKCCMYCIPKSIYCIPKTVMELDVRRCRLSWVVQWTHNRSTRQYHQHQTITFACYQSQTLKG